MNRYRMFYVQTSTLPPRMHQNLTKHGRFCKQNNQLLTKSHVELKYNSNMRETKLQYYTKYDIWCHMIFDVAMVTFPDDTSYE